jgi:hypothetical protein
LKELSNEGVTVRLADGEGDPYCVALASSLRGYVAGIDSDYLVLNAAGYLGYIPLDEMVWIEVADENSASEDSAGFQKVKRGARRAPRSTFGLEPPSDYECLKLNVFHAEKLARHLQLPVTLLPLFGCLLGNDFTKHFSTSRFFDKSVSPTARVAQVAEILRNALMAPKHKRSVTQEQNRALALINTSISQLTKSIVSAEEQEDIVNAVIDGVLQYAMPNAGEESAVFSLLPSRPTSQQLLVREIYQTALAKCSLGAIVLAVCVTSSVWPFLTLENPDVETCANTVGAGVREWLYAVLDDGIGGIGEMLEERPEENTGRSTSRETSSDGGDEGEGEDEDEDEVISVVEEETEYEGSLASEDERGPDPLAGLKSVLENLRLGDKPAIATETETISRQSTTPTLQASTGPRYILEYTRRGLRMAEIPVLIRPLSELLAAHGETAINLSLPLQLQPPQARLTLFLTALHSNLPRIKDLMHKWMMVVVTLRWVVWCIAEKSHGEGWTRSEGRAFLITCLHSEFPTVDQGLLVEQEFISERTIQLTAQILAGIEACYTFAETLLIAQEDSNVSRTFSGKRFHDLCRDTRGGSRWGEAGLTIEGRQVLATCWDALDEGLEDVWAREKKDRRAKKAERPKGKPEAVPRSKGSGMFVALAGME